MSLTSKQMKLAAVALMLLWLIGLVAAILLRRHRQKTGDAQHANRPLVVYLVMTGCILLVAGVVYYERRKKMPGGIDAAVPAKEAAHLSDETPPEDTTSPAV
jgi:membrane-associated HD superfamily phosphohydrolase